MNVKYDSAIPIYTEYIPPSVLYVCKYNFDVLINNFQTFFFSFRNLQSAETNCNTSYADILSTREARII